MVPVLAASLPLFIGAALTLGSLPPRLTNPRPTLIGQVLVGLCVLAAVVIGLALGLIVWSGTKAIHVGSSSLDIAGPLTLYLDRLSLSMALMIAVIGAAVSQFSRNYLAGDPNQGRFLSRLSLAIGSTLLLVLAGHLLLLLVAWFLTSLGLHHLLLHFPDRPWAIWAARKKFLISRLGDLFLVAAIFQTYRCFGALDYGHLFETTAALGTGLTQLPAGVEWIGILFALGAMTKSAQFPFHSWLPDTLETPTPVSALMHAGVINAGGYLLIRLSPLMVHSPPALTLLTAVGAFTALFAAVVMLTQTSIKRILAYSTVSQMGFMILQCGLGAWQTALLHIFAHSAYKSYAFLSSGSVLEEPGFGTSPRMRPTALQTIAALGLTLLCSTAALAATGRLSLGINGRTLLWFILCLAVAHLVRTALAFRQKNLMPRAIMMIVLIGALSIGGYSAVDGLLHNTPVPDFGRADGAVSGWLLAAVAAVFLGAFVLDGVGWQLPSRTLTQSFYVHAANGFYLDIPARRITAWFYGQKAAVP